MDSEAVETFCNKVKGMFFCNLAFEILIFLLFFMIIYLIPVIAKSFDLLGPNIIKVKIILVPTSRDVGIAVSTSFTDLFTKRSNLIYFMWDGSYF